jgi:hypothetical protein
VSPVKYELGFYIPEDDILHSHCREHFRSYETFIVLSFVILLLLCIFLPLVCPVAHSSVTNKTHIS